MPNNANRYWCPPKSYGDFPNCFEVCPGRNNKTNPGSVQDIHLCAQQVMPKFFDGLELDYDHRNTRNRILTFNWVLSHTRPSGFRFGGVYCVHLHENILQTPKVYADVNPTTFSSNFGFLHYPLDCLRMEVSAQNPSENSPLTTHVVLELMRQYSTTTANFYNLRKESGRATVSYMRAITDNLDLGTELLLEWSERGSLRADTALAARYSTELYSIAATGSRQGIDISYWQRIHDRIQMASLFAWHRKTNNSIGSLCYQWNFDDAVVRGMFNSDLSVGFMYHRYLSHLPCGIGMSILISLPTNRFIFGLKFNLHPSGLRRGD